jgi:glycosyltransferase involved in cell wall biosynthesis
MRCFVSIVIATHNREALLAQTLRALAGQRWPRDRFEIIVADNRSTDDTRQVIAAAAARPGAPTIRSLYVAEPGKSFAVNAALGVASGDVFLFTDDDVLPEPTWMDRLVAALEETGADFAAGRILPRWEAAPPAWLSPALYGVLAIPDNGVTRLAIAADANQIMPIGANMALRRSVIDRIGGLRVDLGKLDRTLRTGEDHEFFLRMLHAGFRGVYEPDALVRHWVPRERLERGYFRRWLHQNGRDVARLETAYTPAVARLLGVPRYLWRQAATDAAASAAAALALDDRRWFAAMLRLVWFGGYLRETWNAASARLKGSRSTGLEGSRATGLEGSDRVAPGSASLSDAPSSASLSDAPRSASLSGERNPEPTQVVAGR